MGGIIISVIVFWYIYKTFKEQEKLRKLSEESFSEKLKELRKGHIIELINDALDPICKDLTHNLTQRLENKFFYQCWSYKTDSKELKSNGIKSISKAMLKSYSGERIKLIINQIKANNSAILIFEGQLTNIIEMSRKPFGITPEELLSQSTDELRACKWRYVQWIVGKNIGAPEDILKEFSEKFIFRPLQRLGKTELELFEGKVKSQDDLKRIKDDIKQSTEDDVIKLKDISEDLEKKTKEFKESIESVRAKYIKEYYITKDELKRKKPDMSVDK